MVEIWKEEAKKKAKEYMDTLNNLNNRLENYKNEINAREKRINDLENERNNLLKEVSKLKNDCDNINKINNQLRLEKDKYDDKLNNELRDLQNAYTRQNLELKKAHQTNDSLRDEIEKLEDRITKFENRHNISSPVKRRKISEPINNSSLVGKKRNIHDMYEPNNDIINNNNNNDIIMKDDTKIDTPLVVKGLLPNPNNINEDTKIKNINNNKKKVTLEGFPLQLSKTSFVKDNKNKFIGFEITNFTDQQVELRGFCFSNKKGDKILAIPEKVVKPKETVRVIFGNNDQDKIDSNDLIWNIQGLWDGKSSETLLLKDKSGNYAELFRIDDKQDIPKDNCFVM